MESVIEESPSRAAETAASPLRRAVDSFGLGNLASLFALTIAFVLSRAFLLTLTPVISDVPLYFVYGVAGVDLGAAPYSDDVACEYPPLAYLHFCGIRRLADDRLVRTSHDSRTTREVVIEFARNRNSPARVEFTRRFRVSLMLADLVAAACGARLIGGRYGRRALLPCAWAYVICSVLFGYSLYDRLDLLLMLTFLATSTAWLRLCDLDSQGGDAGRSPRYYFIVAAAYAILGVGIGYKLIPLVWVGPFLACEAVGVLRRRPGSVKSMLTASAALALTAGAPFIAFELAPGNDLGKIAQYHGRRPIECESIWSSIALTVRALSESAAVELEHSFGSFNLVGPIPELLRRAVAPTMIGGWLLIAACAAANFRRYDRRAAFCAAAVMLLWSTLTAHVLSPQYLFWALPIATLLALELRGTRSTAIVTTWSVVTAALTAYVFPFHFRAPEPISGSPSLPPRPMLLPNFDPAPTAILILRNLMFAAGVIALFAAVCRMLLHRDDAACAISPLEADSAPDASG